MNGEMLAPGKNLTCKDGVKNNVEKLLLTATSAGAERDGEAKIGSSRPSEAAWKFTSR